MSSTLIYTQSINGPVVAIPLAAGALDIVWTAADTVNTSAKKIEAKPVDNAAWVQLGRMLSPLKIRVRRS
jgi:hypothetical protein